MGYLDGHSIPREYRRGHHHQRRKEKKKTLRWWQVALLVLLVIVNIAICAGMVWSAYAGETDPTEKPWSGVIAMAFPIALFAVLLLFVIDFFALKKLMMLPLLACVAALPSILNFSPFNIFDRKVPKGKEKDVFTLMSYNVYNFAPYGMVSYKGDYNPYIDFILKEQPDIVCIQEATETFPSENVSITREQTNSLARVYPYRIFTGESFCLLSKFPAKSVEIGHIGLNRRYPSVAAYRVNIKGMDVNIFNLHLCSIGLTREDKQLYGEITSLDNDGGVRSTLRDFKTQLLYKLCAANVQRAKETNELIEALKKYAGPNVIITGDFNDTPGCYALRRLGDAGFHEVYPEVGFGPMITYNANRFYFRIDHTLYKGAMEPLKMEKGDITVSDHYPLTTTFILKDDD